MAGSVYDWMKTGYTMVPNLLIDHFGQLGLNSNEFLFITYLLKQINQSQSADTIINLSNQFAWESDLLYETLNSLLDKNYLNIELVPDEEGKQTDHYTLRPLFDKLDELIAEQKTKHTPSRPTIQPKSDQQIKAGQLIQLFEEEFGRSLSSVELEMLHQWIQKEGYQPDLVHQALKEAAIRQVFNLKYIDRILLNWQKQNIQTVDEARVASQQHSQPNFQSERMTQTQTSKIKIPILEWNKKD
ncbi:DnaD domain-containing protein [Facklamia miroungae]|uniref:DNA replication protein n=1 Tax=Facklamia miroungae TaxID=120956 RepID=A0A1G7PLZ8_9LACT|nr:DnaD domain protein [Facklamia miroungae]NKZ28745.1 DnaD domain protein [Facklamia miroungae]SDF86679.1 DNA replication protein [Facklamia miroungae]